MSSSQSQNWPATTSSGLDGVQSSTANTLWYVLFSLCSAFVSFARAGIEFLASFSFLQGLLVGQLSVVIVLGAFIKFFVFGETTPDSRSASSSSSSASSAAASKSSHARSRTLRKKHSSSHILRPVPSSSTSTQSILRKTYYQIPFNEPLSRRGRRRQDHSTHQPESLDWFNVLLAQTIAQYRQTAYLLKDSPTASFLSSLTATLNNPAKKPSFIDEIRITDLSLGEEFPIFSNCRVISVEDPASDGGRLQALMDVDLSDDNLSIAIETSLVLNYPKPFSAVLPVALSMSVTRFSGTLCISCVPGSEGFDDSGVSGNQNQSHPEASATTTMKEDGGAESNNPSGMQKARLAFSFLPDYRLDLSVHSLIGSRSRLQDVPKVAQLVEARVQAWFEERVVEPYVQIVELPGFWPRMGRTGVRGGSEDAADDDGLEDNNNNNNNNAPSPLPAPTLANIINGTAFGNATSPGSTEPHGLGITQQAVSGGNHAGGQGT